jgi:hypothetical protein
VGSINKGCTYFELMTEDYDIIRTLENHVCMINLLGRLGQLEKALAMIEQKAWTRQNLVVWRTFLSACRNWNSVGFGKQAFEHAIRVGKKDGIPYVFMSHIYASCEIRACKFATNLGSCCTGRFSLRWYICMMCIMNHLVNRWNSQTRV